MLILLFFWQFKYAPRLRVYNYVKNKCGVDKYDNDIRMSSSPTAIILRGIATQ
jgi:hypothetical protein